MRSLIRTVVLFTLCAGITGIAHAQTYTRATDTARKSQAPVTAKPKGPKPITRETSMGLELTTNGGLIVGGLNVFLNIGRVKPKDLKHSDMFYNTRFWQIELGENHHNKEYKIKSEGTGTNNSYKYGKISNFYTLKLGRGYTRMLAGKPDPGSVSIHWMISGGVALGALKPYYLHIYGDPNAIKYANDSKGDFLNQNIIEGNAGFAKGLNESQFVGGGYLKSGIHFDFSANRKNVVGLEAGAGFEYYSQDIPLMANQPAVPYFAHLYMAFQYGRRK
jgi:hypothetical protein